MFRLMKILFYLVVLLAFLLVGFAFLGDLTPERTQVTQPVELDAN
jgi:hypothetical protein